MLTLEAIHTPSGLANMALTTSLILELRRLGVIDAASEATIIEGALHAIEMSESEVVPRLIENYRAARIIIEATFPPKQPAAAPVVKRFKPLSLSETINSIRETFRR